MRAMRATPKMTPTAGRTAVLIGAVAVLIAMLVSIVPTAQAKDGSIDWSFGTERGGTTFDLLQCQSFTFDWTGAGGSVHNVYEFPDEESYDACTFDNAIELADTATSNPGTFVLSGNDTLNVTKRWFGCNVGTYTSSHCRAGQMKVALKIRPLFVEKHFGSECAGGTVDVIKMEPTLKACRKRCKRRRGCFAIQYDTSSLECSAYDGVPFGRGGANLDVSCEIAATSCQNDQIQDEKSIRQDALNAARQTWDDRGPIVDYEFQTRRSCYCTEEYRKELNVTVLEGTTVGAIYADGKGGPVPETMPVPSISNQFETIQWAIDNDAHTMTIEYHKELGYPLSIYIDYEEMIADEELAIFNKGLVPITSGKTDQRCGSNVCLSGQYCCNESCSICAPMGGSCIQLVC